MTCIPKITETTINCSKLQMIGDDLGQVKVNYEKLLNNLILKYDLVWF